MLQEGSALMGLRHLFREEHCVKRNDLVAHHGYEDVEVVRVDSKRGDHGGEGGVRGVRVRGRTPTHDGAKLDHLGRLPLQALQLVEEHLRPMGREGALAQEGERLWGAAA